MAARELCKVLIVDDEILIRQGIKHYMNWEQEGFCIAGEAGNGKEALELIEKVRPHIVLTDIVMPVMDGNELTKAVKASYPGIEVVVLSSFGDFDYVRATFQSGVADYILKPKLETEELLGVLRKTAGRIGSLRPIGAEREDGPDIRREIERMIAGYETESDAEEIRRAFPYGAFRLLGMECSANGRQTDGEAVLRTIAEAAESAASGSADIRTYVLLSEPNVTLAVLNYDAAQAEHAAAALADAAAAAVREADPLAFVALTEPFAGFHRLGDTYRGKLRGLLQAGFYFPERHLIEAGKLPASVPAAPPFPLDRFAADLARRQFDAAFGQLRKHVAAMSACYTTDAFEYKSFLSNIIFNIIVLLGNAGYDVKPLERIKFASFNAINESRCAQDAADRLFAFVEEAIGCADVSMAAAEGGTGGANMKRLLDYMEAHYAEPLTLKEMAKHFHFNPSYLSSTFSAHNPDGFAGHLNKIRIGKAAGLLREGELAINEISGLVGYSDHSYFCKVFKKLTGLSPSSYRRQPMS
ncbi:response regulator transcription factor [Paenibacillus methanolicus]|uniref:Two-component system response regulator YesN n=1 Tax=Paenibacillus methanolicus TaxID=582686 RepID=A0A5S5CHV1_9BACL|nr:response regulator transcription factor [Paenibacillus methanolicus]TYP78188.1 two-component system response regulator YesN [Paenibacillus methanolicus]